MSPDAVPDPTPRSGTPPEASRTTLRHDILAVALRLLTSDGPKAVTIRGIARELGVSPGAAYHHFDGKGALYRALVADGLAAVEQAVAEAAPPDDAPALDRLVAVARAYAAFGLARPEHYYVMFMLRADGIPELSDADKAPGLRVLARTAEAVAQGAADGTLRPSDNPFGDALALWATLHGVLALAASQRLAMAVPGVDAADLFEHALERTIALLRA